MNLELKPAITEIKDLKPHPRNYRVHPDDQLEHIMASIREHGIYRNVVVARDGTILAGHGVVAAMRKMGETQVPAIWLDVDPESPQALKLLAGDNEVGKLGEVDDRMLSQILADIKAQDNLLGTGYDEMMLANLIFVTRPREEIKDFNAAVEWVGMPGYKNAPDGIYLSVTFQTEEDRLAFIEKSGAVVTIKGERHTWSARWPEASKNDLKSLTFEQSEDAE